MNKIESARNRSRANILKSIAHPSRLFIVEKLAEKPHSVTELTELIGVDTSTVSKHLSILRNAGIITDERRGVMVYYSLVAPCILKFISCVEEVITLNIKRQMFSIEKE
jgi:ArsR family transcriptional regulator